MRFSAPALTLFFTALLLVLPSATAVDPIYLNSRDVGHRMLRKRAAQGLAPMPAVMINRRVTDQSLAGGLAGLFGGGEKAKTPDTTTTDPGATNTTDPTTGNTTGNSTTTDPTGGSTTNTTDTNPQNPVNPNNNGGASISVQPSATASVASPSATSASQTSSVAPASSHSDSATLNLSFLPTASPTFTDPFATNSAATESSTTGVDGDNAIAPGVQDKSAFGHTTIIILIVVASCVVAAAIIWTVIRKWKFSPSRQFEDRLQRIDWEPSAGHEGALSAGLGGGFRHGTSTRDMSERRTSHGSFGSSDRAQVDAAPDFPPAHDFTATTTVPLARGPSLNRGASLSRGNTNMTRGPSYGRAHYGAGYGAQQPNYGYGY